MEALRIEEVRVGDLPAFARRAEGEEVVPISAERALAQSLNPHAAADDVGLLAAYRGGRCVGYMGLLPQRLRTREGDFRIHWMSTWFVPPRLRGEGVGFRLLSAALGLGYDVFGTGYTPAAGRALRRAGFAEIGAAGFHTVSVRRVVPWTAPLTLLRRQLRRAGREGGRASSLALRVERLAGAPAREVVYRGLERLAPDGVRWEEVERIAEDAAPPDEGAVRFLRGPEVANWMLRHPWVVEDPRGDSGRYHFTRARRLFRQTALELRGPGARRGYAVLSATSLRERTVLRVLDHRLDTPEEHAAVAAAAAGYARRHQADALVFPEEFGPVLGRLPGARLLLKRGRRPYLCRPHDPEGPVARALDEIRLSYVDADVAFT